MNAKNLTTGIDYSYGGVKESIDYTYNESKDNAPENTYFTDSSASAIAYDALGRKSMDALYSGYSFFLKTSYSYLNNASNSNRTSGLVSKIDYDLSSIKDLEYSYDSRGNIVQVIAGDVFYDKYTYDKLNRLVRVDSESEGKTYVYTYDASGNMQTKSIYTCNYINEPVSSKTLIDTITYTYGAVDWKDRLTAYDGKIITYDSIGNPIYYDGNIFTWLGRRLYSYNNGSTTTSYTYNSDGIRTSKTVGSTTTEYFLNGSQILAQKTGSNVIPFYYDANGTRIAFKYNGTMYYYVYNLQGDVTHILDASKNIVGTYQYDAWGKILNLGALSEVGNANPFRYRGYYYDNESGLYYLNSRYYNAEWGRFINADGYVSTGQGITGYNMFAYCGNNPVNRVDPTGRFWKEVGSFFCKAWSKVKTFVNSTFGAEKITTTTIFEAETPVVPLFLPFSITDTVETTQIVSSKGDSTKPVSVYVDKSLPNSIFSSTVGVKINTSKSTLIISLGLDNTGIYTSTISENTTVESGCRLNLSKLRFGYQHSVAIQYDSSIDTTYTNYSLNGWSLLYAYCYVMTGQQMPQSQYAYSY